MRIRLAENVESIRAEPLTRLATPQHAIASASTSVALSSTARALTAALAQELLGARGGELQDLLLERDRMLLTWASQLIAAAGGESAEGEQLERLARDLVLFRAQPLEAAPPLALEARVTLASLSASAAPLTLPLLSSEDESLARSLLLQIGARETVLDRALLRSLVEPDRVGRSVSLRFLQRLVVSLWPHASASESHAHALTARRDAYIGLSAALSRLVVSHDELSATAPQQRAQGTKWLGAQLTALSLADRTADSAPLRPFATLTRNDRALLALLHAADTARGGSGEGVAQVVRALLTLRLAERAELDGEMPEVRDGAVQLTYDEAPEGKGAPTQPRELAGEPEVLNGYGSRTQLAARVASTYRVLAMEGDVMGPSSADLLRSPAGELPANVRDAAGGGRVLAYLTPLDLTQALGLGALIAQSHVRALRALRARRRRSNVIRALRAIERHRRRRDTREQVLESTDSHAL